MARFSRKWPSLLSLLLLAGCGSEDEFTANMAGTYTLALKSGKSSCAFENWMEGGEATGVGFVVTQDGSQVHGQVEGVAAILFTGWLGSADFEGSIRRNHFELTNYGSNSAKEGDCVFTYNARVVGDIDKDAISGTITYAPVTSGSPACSAVECEATQSFSGSRPPVK